MPASKSFACSERPKAEWTSDALSAPLKSGLVQFRADPVLMADLTQAANSLHLPIGTLARLWVSERLNKESSVTGATTKSQQQGRHKTAEASEPNIRRTKMIARTEMLELLGTNKSTQRVDLILQDGAETIVVGKVRPPALEPTSGTKFRCLVNEDEMSPGAKERLERKWRLNTPATFRVGDFTFSGRISRITPGFRGGAMSMNELYIKDPTLMFDVEPA